MTERMKRVEKLKDAASLLWLIVVIVTLGPTPEGKIILRGLIQVCALIYFLYLCFVVLLSSTTERA